MSPLEEMLARHGSHYAVVQAALDGTIATKMHSPDTIILSHVKAMQAEIDELRRDLKFANGLLDHVLP